MTTTANELSKLLEGEKFYRIQVGAFRSKENAEIYLKRLQRAGFLDAFIKFE